MPTLHWLTREQDLKASGLAPYRLLDHVETYGDPNTENMLIQGDNLDGLKALLPYYAGKVKCIYIDPPYNTRSAFEHYDDNMEHTKWLSMIYPRLELLRELLSEDGSVWISLDDSEAHYLKIVADEIFGRCNFIANAIWEKKYSPQNDATWLSDNHDHIFVIAKDKSIWRPNLLPRTEEMDSKYKNPDNDPRGDWKPSDLSVRTYSAATDYEITLPSGRVVTPPKSRCWGVNQEKFLQLLDDNRIWFGKKGDAIPQLKRFRTEVKDGTVCKTLWFRSEVGDNQEAKQGIKIFTANTVFTTPKPERLIQRVLHIATNPGDIVLDSFLGSGTTAAVAHKMGRKYIGIEIGEHATTHCIPRLQKVIEGEQGGISKAVNWQGGGFRFYRLGDPIFDDDGQIRQDIRFPQLAAHVWFSETKTPWQPPQSPSAKSPLLGVHEDTAYYLLYNGILKDKSVNGGNVLTSRILVSLAEHDGPKVIYGERCLFSPARLKQLNITFKHTPYDIKGR